MGNSARQGGSPEWSGGPTLSQQSFPPRRETRRISARLDCRALDAPGQAFLVAGTTMSDFRSEAAEIFHDWSLYDRVIHWDYMRHREMAAAIGASAAGLAAPLHALDLGCGDGRMARAGLRQARVASYVGVDLSAAALAAAPANLAPLACPVELREVELAVAVEQAFQPSPNFALASYSLHHYRADAVAEILTRLRGLLSPGGLFVWIDLERRAEETRAEYLERFWRDELSQWSAIRADEAREIIDHMASADFPLTSDEKQSLASAAGFRWRETPFRNAFYAADLYATA